MPVKIVEHPVTGQQFRLGRKMPTQTPARKLRLSSYKVKYDYPKSIDYAEKARNAINRMYLNDQIGCCVIAGMAHLLGVYTGNATGVPIVLTNAEIKRLYGEIGGYDGTAASDNGCDEVEALEYWRKKGIAGRKIVDHVAIDGSDIDEVRMAIWLFGGIMSGTALPNAWVDPMPRRSGFVLGVSGDPVPENGHCMVHCGYDADKKRINVSTWGMLGSVTDEAVKRYMTSKAGGELHAILSRDVIAKGKQKAPNGLDWARLERDWKQIDWG